MITAWANKNIPPQTGRRILVTGANSGIGHEAALELARAGAEVTLISRSKEKAQSAATRIIKIVPQARLELGVMVWFAKTSYGENLVLVTMRYKALYKLLIPQ